MDLSTTTVPSTVGRTVAAPPSTGEGPRWARPAVVGASVVTAAAVAVGALEARLPVGPGGTESHHVYPFATAALGLLAAVLAARTARRSGDRPWLRLLAAGGVGYTLNALVIAALMYAVTPQGAGWPLRALAWVEGWLWMPFDVIMFGLLVLLLPGARRDRGWWRYAGAVGAVTAAGMLLNAFAQPVMENTDHLANPLAIPALAPLGGLGDLACLLALVLTVFPAIGRHAVLLARKDPAGRRVGRTGLPLALGALATFVAQAALTPDGAGLAANLAAGAAIVVGGGVIAVGGCRLASR